jgi:hypothetical protein
VGLLDDLRIEIHIFRSTNRIKYNLGAEVTTIGTMDKVGGYQ